MDGDSSEPMVLKIIVNGDSSVGKSNLLLRYIKDKFDEDKEPTIGVEFLTKQIVADNKKILLQVWDTAGQERYSSVSKSFYRGSTGVVVVYDISSRKSFQNLDRWVKEITNNKDYENLQMVIIGNKKDLEE